MDINEEEYAGRLLAEKDIAEGNEWRQIEHPEHPKQKSYDWNRFINLWERENATAAC